MRTKKALQQSVQASSFVLLRIDVNRLAIDNNDTAGHAQASPMRFLTYTQRPRGC
ncbi:hypothetical protein BH10CYA1_BH10CYA1_21780 [soil metagenome]